MLCCWSILQHVFASFHGDRIIYLNGLTLRIISALAFEINTSLACTAPEKEICCCTMHKAFTLGPALPCRHPDGFWIENWSRIFSQDDLSRDMFSLVVYRTPFENNYTAPLCRIRLNVVACPAVSVWELPDIHGFMHSAHTNTVLVFYSSLPYFTLHSMPPA